MSNTHQERRHFLLLAVMAAPTLAVGAWLDSNRQRATASTATADGQLRFFSAPDGIHWNSADGSRGGSFLPLGVSFALAPGSIAPGNGHLAYSALDRRTGSNIWTVPIHLRDGQPVAGQPVAFFHSGNFDVNPQFLPDGRRIAFASRDAGIWGTQVRNFL